MMDVNQTDCFIQSKVDVICDYYYQISDFYSGLKLMFCIHLFQTDLLYIYEKYLKQKYNFKHVSLILYLL